MKKKMKNSTKVIVCNYCDDDFKLSYIPYSDVKHMEDYVYRDAIYRRDKTKTNDDLVLDISARKTSTLNLL